MSFAGVDWYEQRQSSNPRCVYVFPSLQVKHAKCHCSIVSMQVQAGVIVTIMKKQGGAKKGSKQLRRINPEKWEALQASQEGHEGGVGVAGFELEPAERHKELVRKMAKLYFPNFPETETHNELTAVLRNVSWDETRRRIVGYYYDESQRQVMPQKGRYCHLEHEDMYVCSTDDIDEHRRENEEGETQRYSEW